MRYKRQDRDGEKESYEWESHPEFWKPFLMVHALRPLFDHEVGLKIDFPIQDDADMKEAVGLDLEVRRERVLMPAEKDAGGDGLDVHGRGLEDASVACCVFDHFLMEHLVLAPAGDGVKLFEMVGE